MSGKEDRGLLFEYRILLSPSVSEDNFMAEAMPIHSATEALASAMCPSTTS